MIFIKHVSSTYDLDEVYIVTYMHVLLREEEIKINKKYNLSTADWRTFSNEVLPLFTLYY
jgi:hypothetical protein